MSTIEINDIQKELHDRREQLKNITNRDEKEYIANQIKHLEQKLRNINPLTR